MAELIYDITSRTNPLVVKTASLASAKSRRELGLYMFEGVKLFCEALDSGISLEYVFVKKSSLDNLCSLLDRADCRAYVVPDICFEKISTEKAPQGIITVAKLPKLCDICDSGSSKNSVILYDIQDAGNLGTIIRTAHALSDIDIVLCGDCADAFGYKCIRASMGAVFRQRIYSCSNFEKAVALYNINGKTVYAAALRDDAAKISDCALSSCSVVLGNEGHGLPDEAIALCKPMIIPMVGMESLNVAAAATVIIWEMAGRG